MLFVVVSVVEPGSRALSYGGRRSLYSPEERLAQMLLTIASIRKNAPGARTTVLELGRRDVGAELAGRVDGYHYLGRNPVVRLAVDGPHKGLGEAVGLLAFLIRTNPFEASRFVFKLSGRYRVAEGFDPSHWEQEQFNFHAREGGLATRLYGLPARFRWRWIRLLVGAMPRLALGESIESAFARRLRKSRRLNLLSTCGVEGECAMDRSRIYE